jgi:integrase/recombinase XerD
MRKRSIGEGDPYTDKEYKAIVAAADRVPTFTGDVAERAKALIAVMRFAGLAIQDAAILERGAVTPATVNGKACYRVELRRSKTHTGVNNVVPKDLCDALLRVANGNPKYIFWSGNGEPVSTTKHWSARLKKVFDASGVKDAHSHRFRKTFGVDLLTHGAPLEMVSKALGHKNTVITERHYLKWVPKLQEQLAEYLGPRICVQGQDEMPIQRLSLPSAGQTAFGTRSCHCRGTCNTSVRDDVLSIRRTPVL